MTEGFGSPPVAGPSGWADTPASRRQEVTDTVQRIMGEDIAPPPQVSPRPSTASNPSTSSNGNGSTTDVAKEQAGEVAGTAKEAGVQVTEAVKEQAGQVTAEATHQAKQLLSQAQSELSEQAANTQHRVSEGLQALADELSGMARNSEQDGVATDLARQAADRARSAAGWLADRDPGSLLDEVRAFARRKPGTYLALALGAGVVAGRLTRGLTASSDGSPAAGSANLGTSSPSAYPVDTGRSLTGNDPGGISGGYEATPIGDPVLPVSAPIGVGALAAGRGDLAP